MASQPRFEDGHYRSSSRQPPNQAWSSPRDSPTGQRPKSGRDPSTRGLRPTAANAPHLMVLPSGSDKSTNDLPCRDPDVGAPTILVSSVRTVPVLSFSWPWEIVWSSWRSWTPRLRATPMDPQQAQLPQHDRSPQGPRWMTVLLLCWASRERGESREFTKRRSPSPPIKASRPRAALTPHELPRQPVPARLLERRPPPVCRNLVPPRRLPQS